MEQETCLPYCLCFTCNYGFSTSYVMCIAVCTDFIAGIYWTGIFWL